MIEAVGKVKRGPKEERTFFITLFVFAAKSLLFYHVCISGWLFFVCVEFLYSSVLLIPGVCKFFFTFLILLFLVLCICVCLDGWAGGSRGTRDVVYIFYVPE